MMEGDRKGSGSWKLKQKQSKHRLHVKEFLHLKKTCEEEFTQVFFNWKKNHFVLEGYVELWSPYIL